ncbi:MAG: amidohydrolase family protein [Planctomycetota bacterium]
MLGHMERWRAAGVWAFVVMFSCAGLCPSDGVFAQVAVRGAKVYTMAGPPIENGVVVIRDGKISAVGKSGDVAIPEGFRVFEAAVVTPGLVDAHSVVGVAGIYNNPRGDQDQLERSEPIQPELRALDAYNPHEELVAWVRGFGVTTVHTGHAPGELITGQSIIVKTTGNTVEEAVIVERAALTATLAQSARKDEAAASPGTRGKMVALLRAEFVKAQEYRAKRADADAEEPTERSLRLDALVDALDRKLPVLITAHRAQDIASALRLQREFGFKLWLDGCAEGYVVRDAIKAAGVPVILHPSMQRSTGEAENLSFETAAKLRAAGIPVALQSHYEGYVPKTRVVLFEAAIAAANGLGLEGALETITIAAAKILGIDDRVGSLAVGKDGDIALYDGDPFEYTTHCIATIIEGKQVSQGERQ